MTPDVEENDTTTATTTVAATKSSSLATGAAVDVEPSYDNLDIKEVDNHIVLEWDQDGVPFRQVVDMVRGHCRFPLSFAHVCVAVWARACFLFLVIIGAVCSAGPQNKQAAPVRTFSCHF